MMWMHAWIMLPDSEFVACGSMHASSSIMQTETERIKRRRRARPAWRHAYDASIDRSMERQQARSRRKPAKWSIGTKAAQAGTGKSFSALLQAAALHQQRVTTIDRSPSNRNACPWARHPTRCAVACSDILRTSRYSLRDRWVSGYVRIVRRCHHSTSSSIPARPVYIPYVFFLSFTIVICHTHTGVSIYASLCLSICFPDCLI